MTKNWWGQLIVRVRLHSTTCDVSRMCVCYFFVFLFGFDFLCPAGGPTFVFSDTFPWPHPDPTLTPQTDLCRNVWADRLAAWVMQNDSYSTNFKEELLPPTDFLHHTPAKPVKGSNCWMTLQCLIFTFWTLHCHRPAALQLSPWRS